MELGVEARVLEAGSRPGGVIATVEQDGFHFELGPQSFLSTQPLLKLIDALGLSGELLHANPKAPRYILVNRKLVPAPLSPPALIKTSLLGAGTKWRILTEMLRQTRPPDGDESVATLTSRKFGAELLDKLVAPFVSGIYAGDPERLSVRAAFPTLYEFETKYGSVLRGAMKSRPSKGTPRAGLCSFREGMQTLPRALGERLGDSLLTETRAEALQMGTANGKTWFEIDVRRCGQHETLCASAVIVATPTATASQILNGLSDQFAPAFAEIEYAPVAVVAAGYRRDQIQHAGEGFGFLVPRSEGLRLLGTVWNSSLFAGRAPEGMACYTSFAGGATDPELFSLSDAEIAELICDEVGRVLGVTGKPVTTLVHRYARALPQYNLGHTETIATLAKIVSGLPGLFLIGNYLSGPSIGACVEQANATADAVRLALTK